MWNSFTRGNGGWDLRVGSGRCCLLIGNTRWHWAEERNGTWTYFHTEPEPQKLQKMKDQLISWASVGAIPQEISLDQQTNLGLSDIPIKGMPYWLGIDRGLAAWGALKRAEISPLNFQGILIADAGTVLSLTRLNANGEFAGGQLAPGLNLQLSLMAERTEALQYPGIEKVPTSKFPIQTNEAMQIGSIQSLVGMLIEAQREAGLPLWLCGGDASLLFDQFNNRNLPISLYPNLVLEGMVDLCSQN